MEPSSNKKRAGTAPVILIVDDETSVLSSLRRLFRGKRYEIITESDPANALARIDKEPIDLIISDMRMPQISGTDVLRHAATRQPDSVRVLLTGYADLEDAIEAVNTGGIFRYLTKPWNNQEIIETVESGLYVRELEARNRDLADELSRQNEALKDLTAILAGRVRNRNRTFEADLKTLTDLSARLDSDMTALLRMTVGLIEHAMGEAYGQTSRAAKLARALAGAAQCNQDLVRHIGDAALLHELSNPYMEIELLQKPEASLSKDERKMLEAHAQLTECALGQITRFQESAKLIRHMHEHFDGCGGPDHLSRIAIPLGSRILSVACAYEKLRSGSLLGTGQTPAEAMDWVKQRSGRHFDPDIVSHLENLVDDYEVQRDGLMHGTAKACEFEELAPGMVLAEDLLSVEKIPLALAGDLVDDEMLNRLRRYLALGNRTLSPCIRIES